MQLNCPAENVGTLPSVLCFVWNANFRAATNKFSSMFMRDEKINKLKMHEQNYISKTTRKSCPGSPHPKYERGRFTYRPTRNPAERIWLESD